MKKIIVSLLTILVASNAAFAQDNLVNSLKANQSDSAKAKFQFTSVIDLENSPVKSQGSSGTCWTIPEIHFLKAK